ncbi:hypothetical protein SAMN05446635_6829 [Burkholderia sp. OK233]|nr:hypothetical protein SAMN05446635_6829 [Burkholderia sp. OK233]
MDILKMAMNAGMQVILDGRIGTQSYQSVYGSIQALQRFAEALRAATASETQSLVEN